MRSRAYADGCMLEEDGESVGFGLVAKTWSREAGGMTLWLEELFILPQYRSRGLGSALVLEFLLYYLTKPKYQLKVREEIYLDNMLDLF